MTGDERFHIFLPVSAYMLTVLNYTETSVGQTIKVSCPYTCTGLAMKHLQYGMQRYA